MRFSHAFTLALALLSSPAYAHVTANPDHGDAGSYFQTSFRISHGCDGSPTKAVQIDLPPGFLTVKPQAKPGWKIDIVKRKLEKPVPAGHGKIADEEFSRITWSGGELADDQYDEFGLLVKLPETEGKIWFPVIQTCTKGENRWTEIPSTAQEWHDMKSPAPFVDVSKPTDPHAHH